MNALKINFTWSSLIGVTGGFMDSIFCVIAFKFVDFVPE